MKYIKIEEPLTPLKAKILNLFKSKEIMQIRELVKISNLKYKQVDYLTGRFVKEGILERKGRGLFRLTNKGRHYLDIVEDFNLRGNSNFRLIGFVDVDKFLNGSEGAVIVSGLLSDGCVHKSKIKFLTNDESLNKYVWDNLSIVFRKRVNRKYGFMDGRLFSEFLRQFVPTYRTSPFRDMDKNIKSWPSVKVPDFIMNGTEEQKCEFMKVYASSDGGIIYELWWYEEHKLFYLRAWIMIACENLKLKQDICTLLKGLEFEPKEMPHEILLTGKDVEKFRQKIGFVNGCKVVHGKHWKGIEKNRLLNLAHLLNKGASNIIPFSLRKDKTKEKEIRKYLLLLISKIENYGLENISRNLLEKVNYEVKLRKTSKYRIQVLEILENSDFIFNQLIKEMMSRYNYKNKFHRAKHNLSLILSRMKRDKLIINEPIGTWKITKKGKRFLYDYRDFHPT